MLGEEEEQGGKGPPLRVFNFAFVLFLPINVFPFCTQFPHFPVPALVLDGGCTSL